MTTPHQCKYWAAQLALNGPSGSLGQLSRSLSNSRIDLNPHQVDAALFAVRSPLSKGVVLADEVGLGKTIEAGLVLAQRWAERHRRILVIVPATLRNQWAQELQEKFHLPSIVLESTAFNRLVKEGSTNPFVQDDCIVICSYHFAANKAAFVDRQPWDLVVIDEAHRLRNVYKPGNKIARALQEHIHAEDKVLLTATPLQNSLMELYGLIGFIDPHVFGDEVSFREQFVRNDDETARNARLRRRLDPVCHRTLRRQVVEYIRFTKRIPITHEFLPTDEEHQLYEDVSAYLRRERLHALPTAQRMLITMVLRKLLASSSFAIAGTLRSLLRRLETELRELPVDEDAELESDYESLGETRDEWGLEDDAEEDVPTSDRESIQAEIDALRGYVALAERIEHNAKGHALLDALEVAFRKTSELGGRPKAVVFTESMRTQAYLFDLLERSGYEGRVVLMNGTNNDARSKQIYGEWVERRGGARGGSRQVDVKAAIVEEFRDRATILVATEAAAEGVNLQFCSLVVNYDLPWNPQRIEQRIGRCHRYGQKHDVVVVNFLNKRNAADQRVHQLLAEKFHLFDGVFGSSDQVLGALESGVDVERRIAEIYQECRSEEAIAEGFARLQADLDEEIQDRMAQTRSLVLEHFDEDIHQRLRLHRDRAQVALDDRERRLLALTRHELGTDAHFEDGLARFDYRPDASPLAEPGTYNFDWREAERRGDEFFRTDHPLARAVIDRALGRETECATITFDYDAYGATVSILAERLGARGWLRVARVRVQSVEAEEHLIVTAGVEDPEEAGSLVVQLLDAEWCDRLLNLPGSLGPTLGVPALADGALESALADEHARLLAEIEQRNGAYFEEEVEKLDRWAEDVKSGLERELKEIDAEIRAASKESKTKVVLAEKVAAQRRVRQLDQRRTRKRRELYEAQDEVDRRRTELIEETEARLHTSADRETLLTIRWELPLGTRN
ncbi:MAG: DEAD/DEAH box helicase family protein [Planctomycetes bacterium]|nr:DEAD/DEAH box helicase family protein [Planctomycetota bacterium]